MAVAIFLGMRPTDEFSPPKNMDDLVLEVEEIQRTCWDLREQLAEIKKAVVLISTIALFSFVVLVIAPFFRDNAETFSTPRNMIKSLRDGHSWPTLTEVWVTVQTQPVLDWPTTYFLGVIFIGFLLLMCALIFWVLFFD